VVKVLVKLDKQGFLSRMELDKRKRKKRAKFEYISYRADRSTQYLHSESRKGK